VKYDILAWRYSGKLFLLYIPKAFTVNQALPLSLLLFLLLPFLSPLFIPVCYAVHHTCSPNMPIEALGLADWGQVFILSGTWQSLPHVT
jgi:hypothetical protein